MVVTNFDLYLRGNLLLCDPGVVEREGRSRQSSQGAFAIVQGDVRREGEKWIDLEFVLNFALIRLVDGLSVGKRASERTWISRRRAGCWGGGA